MSPPPFLSRTRFLCLQTLTLSSSVLLQIQYDRSGRSLGIAFVTYDSIDAAKSAREKLDGQKANGSFPSSSSSPSTLFPARQPRPRRRRRRENPLSSRTFELTSSLSLVLSFLQANPSRSPTSPSPSLEQRESPPLPLDLELGCSDDWEVSLERRRRETTSRSSPSLSYLSLFLSSRAHITRLLSLPPSLPFVQCSLRTPSR